MGSRVELCLRGTCAGWLWLWGYFMCVAGARSVRIAYWVRDRVEVRANGTYSMVTIGHRSCVDVGVSVCSPALYDYRVI